MYKSLQYNNNDEKKNDLSHIEIDEFLNFFNIDK